MKILEKCDPFTLAVARAEQAGLEALAESLRDSLGRATQGLSDVQRDADSLRQHNKELLDEIHRLVRVIAESEMDLRQHPVAGVEKKALSRTRKRLREVCDSIPELDDMRESWASAKVKARYC